MTSHPDDQHTAALEHQIHYYAERRPVRMLALDTPYIHRHFSEAMDAAALAPGAVVSEWGSGLGRFTRLLLDAGMRVTAIELSPSLSAELRQSLAPDGERLSVRTGDVAQVLDALSAEKGRVGLFDAMLGFFVLHHVPELERYFRSARDLLRPGGRMVFVEPNPYHPLYPVQIALTPGMRWSAERGIYRLTPRQLQRAVTAAGFSGIRIERYGALPRALYNWAARHGCERTIERLVPGRVKPFQTITVFR